MLFPQLSSLQHLINNLSTVFLFTEYHGNRIMKYSFNLCTQLLLIGTVHLRFIHVIAYISSSLFVLLNSAQVCRHTIYPFEGIFIINLYFHALFHVQRIFVAVMDIHIWNPDSWEVKSEGSGVLGGF